MTKTYFHNFVVISAYPELSGIRIETETGYIYLNRNAKAEVESQETLKEYMLIPFIAGSLNEFPSNWKDPGNQPLYTIGSPVWFYQDETSITFISVYVDPEHETSSTDIARFNLNTQMFENRSSVDYLAYNCLLSDELLYILCSVGQRSNTFYAYAFSLKDLQLLKQSELLTTKNSIGPQDMQLFVQDGMLCGSYESDGEEAIMEIMEAID